MPHTKTSITHSSVKIDALKPYTANARTHPKAQIRKLVKSIRAYGFINPLLVDEHDEIIAGHGRLIAAKEVGLKELPVICVSGLSKTAIRALRLADNQIATESGWDMELVRLELAAITIDTEFDIELTGFDFERVDVILDEDCSDPVQEDIPAVPCKPVSRPGDIWVAGNHRIGCGDVKDAKFLKQVVGPRQVAAAFLDPPYNVKIDGHVCGKGKVKHREFAEASGEMTSSAFTSFLTETLTACEKVSASGAVHFVCMDHRHADELIIAGGQTYGERLNICIWNKSNAGMGSLYRSKHELVFVYRVGKGKHRNNIQLGKHGRNRTNVWDYPQSTVSSAVGATILHCIRRSSR